MTRFLALLSTPVLACSLIGCVVQPEDKGAKFREAVPTADDVKLTPPTGGTSTTNPQSLPGAGLLDGTPSYAKYYKFTRDIFDGVNLGTGYILGSVWLLIQLPPTTTEGEEAIWGPGSEVLSPAEWRFRAVDVKNGEIEYFFEGRAKNTADAWQWILHGKGFSEKHTEHRKGWFDLNYDTANSLDPARLHGEDEDGILHVDYALKDPPFTVHVSIEPNRPGVSFDVTTSSQNSGSGKVDIKAVDDLDDAKNTLLEDLKMHSRWTPQGAGRADVTISGGDVPSNTIVHVSECWSTSFQRTFYTDNVGLETGYGEQSACAFGQAEYE
jgi:hypothetical protein